MAIEGGPRGYLSVNHAGGGNADNPEHVWQYLRDQAGVFDGTLVLANAMYDLEGLALGGNVHFRESRIADVLVAARLHDSRYHEPGPWGAPGYSLDQCLSRAGLARKDESGMLAAWGEHPASRLKDGVRQRKGWEKQLKANLWRLHADDVEPYACRDVTGPLELLRYYEATGDGLPAAVWALEQDVTAALLGMRLRGICVDEERLETITGVLAQAATDAENALGELCGKPVRCMAAADLEPAITAAGLRYARTRDGAPSITAQWLQANPHPLTNAIAAARDAAKMLSMAKSLPKFIFNGRIHASVSQFGAATGRMSCQKPNLQQQPARKAIASEWRKLFVGEPGQHFFSADYSGQEPRWQAHWAAEAGFPEFAQAFRDNPRLKPYPWVGELCGIGYDQAKVIFLGVGYGMGGAKLCRSLGLPTGGWRAIGTRETYTTEAAARAAYREARRCGMIPADWDGPTVWEAPGEEGARILHLYHSRFPVIKGLIRALKGSVAEQGAVWDWMGRKIAVFRDHKALNYITQGSASTHTKRALVDVWKECPEAALHLPVHDELVGSVPDPEIANRVGEIMSRPHSAHVPFVVDPKCGPTWGHCK